MTALEWSSKLWHHLLMTLGIIYNPRGIIYTHLWCLEYRRHLWWWSYVYSKGHWPPYRHWGQKSFTTLVLSLEWAVLSSSSQTHFMHEKKRKYLLFRQHSNKKNREHWQKGTAQYHRPPCHDKLSSAGNEEVNCIEPFPLVSLPIGKNT